MTAIDHTQQPATESVQRPPNPVRFVHDWLRRHDPGYGALRRAGRTALIMPAMLALGTKVIGNPLVALFAAFGSFAMLLLVDFTGPIRDRVRSQALLGVACVGADLARHAGVADDLDRGRRDGDRRVRGAVLGGRQLGDRERHDLAAAGLHPARVAAGTGVADPRPDRRLGDGGGRVGDRDRDPVAGARPATRSGSRRSRAAARSPSGCGARSRSSSLAGRRRPCPTTARRSPRPTTPSATCTGPSSQTPYRPTGLTTSDRAVVRLVDDLRWCNTIVLRAQAAAHPHPHTPNPRVVAVKQAGVGGLDRCADSLSSPGIRACRWTQAVASLHEALAGSRRRRRASCPRRRAKAARSTRCPSRVVSALDPSFRAQELSFVVLQIAANTSVAGGRRQPGLGGARARPAAAGVHRPAVVGRRARAGAPRAELDLAAQQPPRRGGAGAGGARRRPHATSSTVSGSRSARSRCCAPTRSRPVRTRSGRWSGPPPAS